MGSSEMRGGYVNRTPPTEPTDINEPKDPPKEEVVDKKRDQLDEFELHVLRGLAKTIDFPVLIECIDEMARKSGVEQKNINHGAVLHLVNVLGEKSSAVADYVADRNVLRFHGGFMGGKAVKKRIAAIIPRSAAYFTSEKKFNAIISDPEIRLLFLCRFIHEAIHSMTRVRIIETEGEMRHKIGVIGFDLSTTTKVGGMWTEVTRTYEAFNEGITERLEQMVFVRYIKQTGLNFGKKRGSSTTARNYIQRDHEAARVGVGMHAIELLYEPYKMYNAMVHGICNRIASETGHRWEDVWHSFVQGAFGDGPGLFTDEMRKELAVIFGDYFLHDLSKLTNKSPRKDFSRFFKKYLRRNLTSALSPEWSEYLNIKDKPRRVLR